MIEGRITFSSACGDRHAISQGEALHIPQGELHSVEVGPNGVTYRIWTPELVSDEMFRKEPDQEELALIRKNLKVPDAESRIYENPCDTAFFEHFLSKDLIFRSAGGDIFLGKEKFLDRRPVQVTRSSSGSVRVLHKAAGSLIIIATTVHTRPKRGGPRKSFANLRLLVKDDAGWKCLVGMNYPEPTMSTAD